MAKSRVQLDSRFRQHRAELDRGMRRGMERGGTDVVRAARSVATRYRIQGVLASIHTVGVRKTRKGYELVVAYGDWRGLLFEGGTYQKKGALRTKRKSASTGNRGVRGGRFLKKGLKEAAPRITERIRSELN